MPLVGRMSSQGPSQSVTPLPHGLRVIPVDVLENDASYVLRADLPGTMTLTTRNDIHAHFTHRHEERGRQCRVRWSNRSNQRDEEDDEEVGRRRLQVPPRGATRYDGIRPTLVAHAAEHRLLEARRPIRRWNADCDVWQATIEGADG